MFDYFKDHRKILNLTIISVLLLDTINCVFFASFFLTNPLMDESLQLYL